MDKIIALRNRINSIDDQIMLLLNERYDISNQIGEIKSNSKISILDKNREEYVLDKTKQHGHSPQIESVYRTIMSESKNIQRR